MWYYLKHSRDKSLVSREKLRYTTRAAEYTKISLFARHGQSISVELEASNDDCPSESSRDKANQPLRSSRGVVVNGSD